MVLVDTRDISNDYLYTIHARKRHQEVKAHLQLLPDLDPEAFWLVILDNASAHTAEKLTPWQQHRDALGLVFLPTDSPHLNVIEILWRFVPGQVTRNHFYESLTAESEAVVNWLRKRPFFLFVL